MKLVKRLIELAFIIFIISLFMKNKDIEMQLSYYWPSTPIKVAFWELVTFCVSLGIIIAAIGDFITQVKWVGERRRLIKKDKEQQGEVDRLNRMVADLESKNKLLKTEHDQKPRVSVTPAVENKPPTAAPEKT